MPKTSLNRSPSLNDLKKRLERLIQDKHSKKVTKVMKLTKVDMINIWKKNVLRTYLKKNKYNSFSRYIMENQEKLEACIVSKTNILEIAKKSLKYNKHSNLLPYINAFTEEFTELCGERAILCLVGCC